MPAGLRIPIEAPQCRAAPETIPDRIIARLEIAQRTTAELSAELPDVPVLSLKSALSHLRRAGVIDQPGRGQTWRLLEHEYVDAAIADAASRMCGEADALESQAAGLRLIARSLEQRSAALRETATHLIGGSIDE